MVCEIQTEHAIPLALTNCNGTLWSYPKNFSKSYTERDLVFYKETHQSPKRPLPPVRGYMCESAFREETKDTGGVHGSRRVAVVFKSV